MVYNRELKVFRVSVASTSPPNISRVPSPSPFLWRGTEGQERGRKGARSGRREGGKQDS